MIEHEFISEIADRIEGTPSFDDDRGTATARIGVTQTIKTSRGPKARKLALYVWTGEERWCEALRLYRHGEPINVFCRRLRPGRRTRVDENRRRRAERELFVVDYLEPGDADSEWLRVEMTGRLVSAPYLGLSRYGRFGHLELLISAHVPRPTDQATAAQLFHARVLGQRPAEWLRDNLSQGDEVTLLSTALMPGQPQPNRGFDSPDEYTVGAPIFNLAERPLLRNDAARNDAGRNAAGRNAAGRSDAAAGTGPTAEPDPSTGDRQPAGPAEAQA